MNVAVCICVYNETTLLEACLRQFPEWVTRITVLASNTPWFGMHSDTEYKTWDILKAWNDHRLEWFKMDWKTEHDQRNWGLGRLSGYDWVLIFDADEYFSVDDWQLLKMRLEEWSSSDVVVADMITYWKTSDWVWEPGDTHRPVIAVRPKRTSFCDKREVTCKLYRIFDNPLHHFSWVRTDEEVKQKIQNYMHAPDFDREHWYVNVWKGWNPDMVGIRPYGSERNTKTIYRPAPKNIMALFKG